MNIATVVEGPTDRLVLEAILNRLFPGEHRYFRLQPSATFGETGTGWKGVRRWCREVWLRGSDISQLLSADVGAALDLLVIHVDADMVEEPDLLEGDAVSAASIPVPCPPVTATIEQLHQVILQWLRLEMLPSRVVLAIPAQDTENWTFAALFPEDPLCASSDYECIHRGSAHPAYLLTLDEYGKLLRRAEGRIKKSQRHYASVTPLIAANWLRVCQICSQAEQFTSDVHTALAVRD